MESLRLKEEAAVAIVVAKAQAIERELCIEEQQDLETLNLLCEDPTERVQHYVNSQRFPEPNVDENPSPDASNPIPNTSPTENVNHLIQEVPKNERLDPSANTLPLSHKTTKI